MKIRISDIPHDGLKVKETLSVESINARMREGEDHGIEFISPPVVDLTVFKTPQGAETRGKVTSRYRQPCSLCIEGVERDIEVESNFIFKAKPADLDNRPEGEEDEDYIDDVGISYFEGEHLELEPIVQETLILSLSIYWHPPVDKLGNCQVCGDKYKSSQCGKNAPSEKPVTLGQLIKAATSKN
jgi:uncharacterized metal-binding protein YceD (DUF177 family)